MNEQHNNEQRADDNQKKLSLNRTKVNARSEEEIKGVLISD